MPTKSWLTPDPPSVAIEIASRRVTVVEVTGPKTGRPTVARQASEPIPAGAVVPSLTALNLVDPAAVAGALERAFTRASIGIPGHAALVVPDSVARVALLPLEQTPARASELDQVVRWQIRKSTPFPLDDAQVTHFPVSSDGSTTTMAAVVARRDVVSEYEGIVTHFGIQPGLVDLASFNVMNAVIGSGTAPDGDWLLVHLADEATTLAILRGPSLMFYRHRMTVDEESLGSLVHQTAMYHEDRLGGGGFARAWITGSADKIEPARLETSDRLGIPVEAVDVRAAADLNRTVELESDAIGLLAAPIGALIRDRAA